MLRLEDLAEIHETLMSARTKWFNLGLALGLDQETLKAIEAENRGQTDTCLCEMLATCLQSGGPLTWVEICTSLRKLTIKRKDLAAQIEDKYSLIGM